MSQENVEVVKRAIDAMNARDVDRYLACCTDDVELQTPLAEVAGVYVGAAGIRRFLADIEDAGPDFRLDLQRVDAVGEDMVIASVRSSASGRFSGISNESDNTNIYDFVEGRIRRVRIFLDRDEALEAVGLAE